MHVSIKKEAVIILGTGDSQLIVINKAVDMGFAVIGVDHNPDSKGFILCDEEIVLSTYVAEPIIDELYVLQKKYSFKGVLCRSSGYPVITMAKIVEEFNLPGVLSDIAELIINKSSLMNFCRNNGINAPAGYNASSLEEIKNKNYFSSFVIKPSFSVFGKKGVAFVENKNNIEIAFKEAVSVTETGTVEVEEFVKGRDVILISVVEDGALLPLVLIDEINKYNCDGKFFGVGLAIPSIFSGEKEEEKIIRLAEQVINKLSIKRTVLNISCRCEPGFEPKLIEIHLDFSGDQILDKLIPASSNFDIIRCFINIMTDRKTDFSNLHFNPTGLIFSHNKKDKLIDNSFLLKSKTRNDLEIEITNIIKSIV